MFSFILDESLSSIAPLNKQNHCHTFNGQSYQPLCVRQKGAAGTIRMTQNAFIFVNIYAQIWKANIVLNFSILHNTKLSAKEVLIQLNYKL